MTKEQEEKLLEIACGLCWYPSIACSQEWLDEKCEKCPLEAALKEMVDNGA